MKCAVSKWLSKQAREANSSASCSSVRQASKKNETALPTARLPESGDEQSVHPSVSEVRPDISLINIFFLLKTEICSLYLSDTYKLFLFY